MKQIPGRKLLYNTGSPAWYSVMTRRGVLEGGGGSPRYTHTHTHTQIHTCIHTHTHVYTHVYTHMHIHTRIHTHRVMTGLHCFMTDTNTTSSN